MKIDDNNVSVRQVSDELSIKLEALPIEIIGLSTRATRLLQKSGVRDCKTALDVIADNFDGYAGIGEKTISLSKGIAADFVELVDNTPIEKLESLVEKREIHFSVEEANLVESFPGIVDLFISNEVSNPERGKDIINRRFNLDSAGKYSLEDIGTYYDITRERVRQLEAKILKGLNSLLNGSLETKDWVLDKSVFEQYGKIEERLKILGDFLSLEKVESEFLDEFDTCLDKGYLSLFLRLSGFVECPTKIDGFRGQIRYGWCTPEFFVKKRLEVVFSALDCIFDGPEKVLLFDLIVSVKKACRRSWPGLSNESLKTVIEMCREFELEDDSVYVGFHSLRSASDKAFRILEASGKPVHFSAIAREINVLGKDEPDFQPVKETNLKNQMIVDSKFSPIGRSGLWGLSEWTNIHTGTIVEAMEKAFHLSGRPMLYQELKSEVLKIRPDASDSSLRVYLDSSPLFSRVNTATWALKTWKIPAVKQKPSKPRVRVSNSQLNVAVKESFPQTCQMTVPELIRNISANTGLAAITVRQKIHKLEFLSIQKRSGNLGDLVTFHPEIFERQSLVDERILLRDMVQDEIRAILFENPNTPLTKGALYKEVCKNLECLRPTFYVYLSEMSLIRQYEEDGKHYAVYDYEEKVEKIDVDLKNYGASSQLAVEIARPLSLLTLDNIDIALFELGLVFENKLKDYLLKSKNEGTVNVKSKDMSRLFNMIECVIREGVVKKGHHLNTLREERNNRAHGKVPTLSERQVLFNKGHYLVDLFVKYIVFFDQKIAS